MNAQYMFRKIKDVKISDIFAAGKLALAASMYPFAKCKYGGAWVVCERPDEARDNGYHFFKYVREHHPEKMCFYAIEKKSPDYHRVSGFGNTIEYGSLKHWFLYLCAEYNISSQKGGKPNPALCAFLELVHFIDSKLVFLQHGVTVNNIVWAHTDITQLKYFICSTKPEQEFIQKNFGYELEQIVLTGMPRFDNLHDFERDPKLVVIMPTWRARFSLHSREQDNDNDFTHSEYKKAWEDLLNDPRLSEMITNEGLRVMFFPHKNMQQFLSQFHIQDKRIIIADWKEYEIQAVLKKAAVMITDYSSVFFDMVYMKKPVIFYQFDYEKFRRMDYQEGYFDYRNNAFGKSCATSREVMALLADAAGANFEVGEDYIKEHEAIFPYFDRKNSERVFNLLDQ